MKFIFRNTQYKFGNYSNIYVEITANNEEEAVQLLILTVKNPIDWQLQ